MAHQPNPDDPYRSNLTDDTRRPGGLDSELQPNPVRAEGPANNGKVAMFAVAIALALGALFYGFNNSTVNQAGTTPSTSTAQTQSPPSAPTGMRDVTPGVNAEPGTTTGTAPARPQMAPSAAPTGGDVNRSGTTTGTPSSK